MVILVAAVLAAWWPVINHIGVIAATTLMVLIQALVACSANMGVVSRRRLSVRRTVVPQRMRMTAAAGSRSNFMVSRCQVIVSSHVSQIVRSHMVVRTA